MRSIGPRRSPAAYRAAAIWDPGRFQDGRRKHGYFEGWYLKCVGTGGAHPIAVIPGVSLDREAQSSHAFVQLIQTGGRTAYWEYPIEEFRFSADGFEIEVGPNRFSAAGMTLDLHGDAGRVSGSVEFGGLSPWPVRALLAGHHGVVSFRAVHGDLPRSPQHGPLALGPARD
jgi:tocopherol cyclase